MKNKKQSRTGKKPVKQTKQKKRASSKTKSVALARHIRDVCALTDPFCIHARASRRPDGLSQNTIPYQVRGLSFIATDANGNNLTVIVPAWGKFAILTSTFIAGAWTQAATFTATAQNTFIATNASEIRIVSFGVTFRSIASMTNCQGLLHSFTLTNATANGVIPQFSNNNVEDSTTPMTSGLQQTIISKPLGSAAHSFIVNSTVTNTFSDFNWTIPCFEIAGGPASTTVAVVEFVFNLELQLSQAGVSSTGMAGAVLGQKPANPIAITAQNAVHSSVPSIIEGGLVQVGRKIETAASNALSSFLDSAADFGLGLLGL